MDKHQISEITAAREYADSQLTKEELAERDARHEAAHVNINESYFEKQRLLEEQLASTNASNAAAQKERDATTNARVAAEQKARIEELYGKTNKPPEGWLDTAGTIPAPRNPSRTLQPMHDPFPSSDPRNGMSEELIVCMGMNPDPSKPALQTKK